MKVSRSMGATLTAAVVAGAGLVGAQAAQAVPAPSAVPRSAAPSAAVPANIRPPGVPLANPSGLSPLQIATLAHHALDAMTLQQRVGQLMMVDCPSTGVSTAAERAIRDQHVGSIILDGNSTVSRTGTRAITDRLQALAPSGVKLLISTDQEGGLVQRMRGQDFSDIPSALTQGTWDTARLRAAAKIWGHQLKAAGINVDLAPVLDTVPPGDTHNPPIGDLDREYSHDPGVVTQKGIAFGQGLLDAGVYPTIKHFPGLGRVTGNTDTTAGVTDFTTTRSGPYVAPFTMATYDYGFPIVMVSSAIYQRIDPGHVAAFSPVVLTDMLRHQEFFTGVVVSDDLGQAKAVSAVPPGDRAGSFILNGGDLVLTVDPATVAPMTSKLVSLAQTRPSFAKQVDASALRVLKLKAAMGLLH